MRVTHRFSNLPAVRVKKFSGIGEIGSELNSQLADFAKLKKVYVVM